MIPAVFITRSGRHVPERDTDQAGSEMLIRTVSRNADGTPRDRAEICVALEAVGGRLARAREEADELDRRGYKPITPPMTPAEYREVVTKHSLSPDTARVIWDVCGRGLTLSLATHWTYGTVGADRYRNLRRRLQRKLREIGWGGSD